MITFILGKVNKIKLEVSASIDISGFSAVFAACASLKSIDNISKAEQVFVFDEGDFSAVTTKPFLGTLMICDADGNEYQSAIAICRVVDSSDGSIPYNQTLNITIGSNKVGAASSGGGGGGGVEPVDLEDPKASVNSLQRWGVEVNKALRGEG